MFGKTCWWFRHIYSLSRLSNWNESYLWIPDWQFYDSAPDFGAPPSPKNLSRHANTSQLHLCLHGVDFLSGVFFLSLPSSVRSVCGCVLCLSRRGLMLRQSAGPCRASRRATPSWRTSFITVPSPCANSCRNSSRGWVVSETEAPESTTPPKPIHRLHLSITTHTHTTPVEIRAL